MGRMKEGRSARRQSRRPAGAPEAGIPAAARVLERRARLPLEVENELLVEDETTELDRLLVRLDTEIADEKRRMSALLTRLRTRIAA